MGRKSPIALKRGESINMWLGYVNGKLSSVQVTAANLIGKPRGPYKVEWKDFMSSVQQRSFNTQTEALMFAKNGCV